MDEKTFIPYSKLCQRHFKGHLASQSTDLARLRLVQDYLPTIAFYIIAQYNYVCLHPIARFIEVSEAFAAVVPAFMRELAPESDAEIAAKVNVNGGEIALGSTGPYA